MALAESSPAIAPPAAEVTCAHCGLPVPPGWEATEPEPSFCCAGCATAWEVIRDGGLGAYYAQPERRLARVEGSGRRFVEFDHDAFRALYVRPAADGLMETDLYLEGVHCASCLWLIERTPRLVPGLARAELDVPRSVVRLAWDPQGPALSAIARTLDSLGYRPHPHRGGRAAARRRDEDRATLGAIGIAGALAINTMLAALALYSGWFGSMEPEFRHYFRWVSLLLATPSLLGPGRVFFRGAWAALRTRTIHMDLPIAIALAAGFTRGAVNTLAGSGPIYLDGITMLVFLLLVARYLQGRAQRAASDSAELRFALSPSTARIRDGDAVREVPTEAVLPGMTIEVRGGETIPADGVVATGRSDFDLSLLSGESRPVAVAPGDRVWAGTVNRRSPLAVRVERTGETTRLGRILREVAAGAARRAPMVQLADRLSGVLAVATLVLAAVTVMIAWPAGSGAAIDRGIALLIVTCPCALALATPLAVSVAIGRAAAAGILIKNGAALESLARPGRLVLDKTGTLTEGRASLVQWDGPDWARALVLAVERDATHPVARGFAEAWPEVPVPLATDLRHTPGAGIEGRVAGRRVHVGSPAFVADACGDRGGARDTQGEGDALTPIHVAVDGRRVARARFGDPLRREARATLERLRSHGWRPFLLSGDAPGVARAAGAALGLAADQARGGATPEDKLAAVEQWEAEGPVVMVGDGINDAAAIARARVGVGVHGGAEACVAAADVFFARPGLDGLVRLTEGAARTFALIRRNIALSIAYNVLGVALAMTGHISPLVAAILMPVSSLSVVLASWRSRTFDRVPG